MTLYQLFLLITVADHGSISGAANTLNMAQPTVTYQIRLLEEELQRALLERKPRGVELTEAGAVVVQEARRVFEIVSRIPGEIVASPGAIRGMVTLGMSPVTPVSTVHFPVFYRTFHRQYPEIKVSVVERHATELLEQVRKGQVDLALLALPVNGWQLSMEPLWTEKLVAIFPPDEEVSEVYPVSALKDREFILLQPEYSLSRTVSILTQAAGFIPHAMAEVSTLGALIGFVSAGLGISIIPRESATGPMVMQRIKAAELDPPQERQLALVYRKNNRLTPAATALAEIIRHYGETLL